MGLEVLPKAVSCCGDVRDSSNRGPLDRDPNILESLELQRLYWDTGRARHLESSVPKGSGLKVQPTWSRMQRWVH